MSNEIIIFDELPSTNDYALELAKNNVANGTAVIARKQSKGRGQYSRVWESPIGSLSLSVVLQNPKMPLDKLTVAIGKTVCNFFETLTGKDGFSVKLPNDILYREKKLCGVLIEATTCGANTACVVGVGVDVNNKWEDSYSLKEIAGCEFDIIEIGTEIRNLIIRI